MADEVFVFVVSKGSYDARSVIGVHASLASALASDEFEMCVVDNHDLEHYVYPIDTGSPGNEYVLESWECNWDELDIERFRLISGDGATG